MAECAGGACFAAGTQVAIGYGADASLQTKSIEDIQEGDWVLARDPNNPDGPTELRQVTAVSRRLVDHLQLVSIDDGKGNVQTLRTADQHPFWVVGQGWVDADALQSGESVLEADGSTATVVSRVREEHPEFMYVYNFEVEGDHNYFVQEHAGIDAGVWVHNAPLSCVKLGLDGETRGLKLMGWTKNKNQMFKSYIYQNRQRLPDMLNKDARLIGEIKNVEYLEFRSQIRDYLYYAWANRYKATIVVRAGEGTTLCPELQQLEEWGWVNIARLL